MKEYWAEWSDSAEKDPELRKFVIFYPDPPDGTVLVRCRCTKDERQDAKTNS